MKPSGSAKTRPENEETSNHSWTASPKGRYRSLVCFQKTGKKGPDAGRSSPCSRNYRIAGIYRQEGRPTNTGCQNTPTQQYYRQLDGSRQKYREKKKNEGEQNGENKRKMARKRIHGKLLRNLDEKLEDIEQLYR